MAEQLWRQVGALTPAALCKRALASYDEITSTYRLDVFKLPVEVNANSQQITGRHPITQYLIQELETYSLLAILSYLVGAKDLAPSRKLAKPSSFPGGDFFARGTHKLPLGAVIEAFGGNPQDLVEAGRKLNGKSLEYGDAAIELWPFPRIPVVVVLRRGDQEFPASASLLFDETAKDHLAIDTLWATAMMCIVLVWKTLNRL